MKIRSSWLERIIVFLCTFFAIGGFFLGWFFDPAWLNRAGSLMIVIGVIAASVRLQEVLLSQIEKFRDLNDEQQLLQLYQEHENFFGSPLNAEYKRGLEAQVNKGLTTMFAAYVERRVQRLKKFELNVLILGTLINGFGDLLVKFAQSGV